MSVESAQIPSTLSQIQRISAHSDLQPIAAEYYNITNASGAPVAGLLVLMDRRQRPVRAELHLHDTTVGALQELAQRQAHLLIRDRYTGDRPLPLNVLRIQLEDERIAVPLEAPPPPSNIPIWLKPVVIGVLALFIFGGFGWFLNDLMTGEPETAAELVSLAGESNTSATVAPVLAEATSAPSPQTEERIFETNGLPVSRNALPLDIGQRVRIHPGYQVALRTEPGAEAGRVLGSMQSGMEATIANGPVWLAGNSDTIVWWYVHLDDGTEAWVAANTSELTLLEPVP